MVKKPNTKLNDGFKASTVKGQKGFDPVYNKSADHRTQKAFLRGMHQHIEAWMIDHPGKRVPIQKIAKMFNVRSLIVSNMSSRIQIKQGLSTRPKGGSNFVLPPRVYKKIREIHSEAVEGGRVKLLTVFKQVAISTGLAISPATIELELKRLEQAKPRRLSFSHTGLHRKRNLSLDSLINLLTTEGIPAKRFRSKPVRLSQN